MEIGKQISFISQEVKKMKQRKREIVLYDYKIKNDSIKF